MFNGSILAFIVQVLQMMFEWEELVEVLQMIIDFLMEVIGLV